LLTCELLLGAKVGKVVMVNPGLKLFGVTFKVVVESLQDADNRVVQSCHLLVCLFIYRHFTVKLAISKYDR